MLTTILQHFIQYSSVYVLDTNIQIDSWNCATTQQLISSIGINGQVTFVLNSTGEEIQYFPTKEKL